jgi:hypothetical protein
MAEVSNDTDTKAPDNAMYIQKLDEQLLSVRLFCETDLGEGLTTVSSFQKVGRC